MGKRQRDETPDTNEEEEADEQFSVESIKRARWGVDGIWEFLTHWVGYGTDDDSWEPESNLSSECDRLKEAFWDDVGGPPLCQPPTVGWKSKKASKDFLACEKKIQDDRLREEARQKEEREEREEKRRKKAKAAKKKETDKTTDRNRGQSRRKKSSRIVQSSDSDSDDDIPLSRSKGSLKAATRTLATDDSPDQSSEPMAPGSSSDASRPNLVINTAPGKEKETVPAKKRKVPSPLFSEDEDGSNGGESSSPDIPLQRKASQPRTQPRSSTLPTPISRNPTLPTLDTVPPQQRRSMGIPAGSSSSLSTKQRLAEQAVQLQNPKSKFSHLKIPKRQLPPSSSQPSNARAGPASAAAASPVQISAASNNGLVFSEVDWIASPPLQDFPQHPDLGPQDWGVPTPQTADSQRTDDFLASIVPAQPQPAPQPSNAKTKLNFKKKWKWTGELYFDVQRDHANRLCGIVITETTSDKDHGGLRFNLVLTENCHSLRLRRMHGIADFAKISNAITKAWECAVLRPNEANDKDAFDHFARFLALHDRFLSAPALIQGQGGENDPEKGLFLVFSPTSTVIRNRLHLDTTLSDGAQLWIAVVQWRVPPSFMKMNNWRNGVGGSMHLPIRPSPTFGLPVVSERMIRSNPLYYRALHVSKMPLELHEFMSEKGRPFGIWPPDSTRDDPETSALRLVLARCGAKDQGLKKDVRAIFIHLAALRTAERIPALRERREKRFDLRFYTYGSHPGVRADRWGIREVWPLGGVITFTARAILDDPLSIVSFVKSVNAHPLWACYVLPSVIGAVCKLSCHEAMDAVGLLQTNDFMYSDVLDLIKDGELSLLWSPTKFLFDSNHPERKKWVDWQTNLLFADHADLLTQCIQIYNAHHSNSPAETVDGQLYATIREDLTNMHIQPVIMDLYRRFVVIRGDDEESPQSTHIEWITQKDFKFKDIDIDDPKRRSHHENTIDDNAASSDISKQ